MNKFIECVFNGCNFSKKTLKDKESLNRMLEEMGYTGCTWKKHGKVIFSQPRLKRIHQQDTYSFSLPTQALIHPLRRIENLRWETVKNGCQLEVTIKWDEVGQ